MNYLHLARYLASRRQVAASAFLCILLTACGGDSENGVASANGGDSPSAPTSAAESSHTIGGTVSGLTGAGLVLQDNAGDDLAVSAGGSFTFGTRIASGSGYAVTVKSQPSKPRQFCTVTNGSGTASASVNNVAVTCVAQKLGYVANNNDGTVWIYAIKADGTLTKKSSVNTPNPGLSYLTLGPDGKSLYALTASWAYPYTIATDGSLTANGSRVSGGSGMAIEPGGKFAYVPFSTFLSMYSIDANGTLTSNGSLPLSSTSHWIAVAPNGKFAYISNYGDGTVQPYVINADGTLTANGSPIATGAFPQPVTVDPSGKFVYVVNGNGANQVSMFTINTDGTLAANGAISSGLSWPGAVVVSPDSKFAYIPSGTTTLLYAINPDGTLTANGTAASEHGPVTFDSSGKLAYVTDSGSDSVWSYTVNADHTFTRTGSVSTGPGPVAFVIAE
ncbi:lactonase family protein [Cupriavidus pauculus]|uniref:Lactonase family protein n=1 Tax=Cupriavidus pauculus TaxID=82633 RepID=A0A2N5CBB7_9BURK|nr:beta-propeller fold lactonase family protein [Cupriavidus pauculus]PLP99519.1 hypothetical protein CYJ10_17060 [Cupriavidus pauculus]